MHRVANYEGDLRNKGYVAQHMTFDSSIEASSIQSLLSTAAGDAGEVA